MSGYLGFYSEWPFFVSIIGLLLIVNTPLFSAADAPPGTYVGRISSIDGLRGFLAFAVVFFHGSTYSTYVATGVWATPPSNFYEKIGPIAVSLFFMITGYLFWSKMLRDCGRPDWLGLYIGRIFRIAPIYLFAVGLMTLIVFAQTDFRFQVPAHEVVDQVSRWLALGFLPGGDINGYVGTPYILAGVAWTLRYEWLFYASLAVTAVLARGKRRDLAFISVGLAAALVRGVLYPSPTHWITRFDAAALFLVGMLCATLKASARLPRLPDRVGAVMILALLAATIAFCPTYSPASIVLLGLVFSLVVGDCSMFGLLTSRPARRLGDISYGIYLLQGLTLMACFKPALLRDWATASPIGHWLVLFLSAVLLIALATAAHVMIEVPGIKLGRRATRFVRSGLQRRTSRQAG